MSRAKRHHHAPQAYLRQFADDDGFLVVYDRTLKLTRRAHIKNVAVENNLYTIYDANGEPSDAIETQWLAQFDEAIGEILPKLLAPHPDLTAEEHEFVCRFLALQHMRTIYMRDTLANVVDMMLRMEIVARTQGMSPEEIDRSLEEWNPHASEREKAHIRQIASDPSQPVEWDAEPWIKAMMRHLPDSAKELASRRWHLIESPKAAFLAGDIPIVLGGLHPLRLGSAPYVVWPLSPTRILLLGPSGSAGIPRIRRSRENSLGRQVRLRLRRYPVQLEEAQPDFVREVNQLVADSAAREIFWNPNTDPTADITLPMGPHQSTVNGIPVADGERFYDVIQREAQEQCSRT